MYRSVLFDLDGTLINTAPDLVNALEALRISLNRVDPLPALVWEERVSQGALALIEAGVGTLSESQAAESLGFFLEHYKTHIFVDSYVFDGIKGVLDACRARGIKLGIVTNKRSDLAEDLLTQAGLRDYFGVLVGGDTLPVNKPAPEPLLWACEHLGVSPAESVMVGDDERDLLAAQAAGMPAIVVGWGFGVCDIDLQRHQGAQYCPKPADLMARLIADTD